MDDYQDHIRVEPSSNSSHLYLNGRLRKTDGDDHDEMVELNVISRELSLSMNYANLLAPWLFSDRFDGGIAIYFTLNDTSVANA